MKFSQYKLRKRKGCSRSKPVCFDSQVAQIGKRPSTTDGPPYTIRPSGGRKYLSYINEEGQTVYAKQISVSPRSPRK